MNTTPHLPSPLRGEEKGDSIPSPLRGEGQGEGRKWIVEGWGVLLGIPALFVAAYFLPRFPVLLEAPLCAVRGFLGVACPGCGLTHAFIALAHGRIRGSVDAHPLGIVIALWLLYLLGRRIAALAIGRRPPELLTQRSRDWCLGAFLAALFSQWIFHLVMG